MVCIVLEMKGRDNFYGRSDVIYRSGAFCAEDDAGWHRTAFKRGNPIVFSGNGVIFGAAGAYLPVSAESTAGIS
jgi:hypothetical protein